MSGLSEDIPNDCTILFYRISIEHKHLIVCLRIYINELYNIIFTMPNSIFLLYDITSEESFKSISLYYKNSINNKKYENIKFVLVGNKKDLISEVDESEENSSKNIQIQTIKEEHNNKEYKRDEVQKKEEENKEDKKDYKDKENNKGNEDNEDKEDKKDNKDNKDKEDKEDKKDNKDKEDKKDYEDKENKKGEEDKDNKKGNEDKEEDDKKDNEDEPLLNLDKKIEKFCEEKKLLHKEISGLTGEGVMELFEEIILILYKDINNMQEDGKGLDITSLSKNIENELNLSSRQSYHSDDYKKEINKINKKRKFLCCYRCNIF